MPSIDSSLCKPTLVNFQGKSDGLFRAVTRFLEWLHLLNIYDGAIVTQKGDRQRNQRITHPEAVGRFVRENKQHAVVLFQTVSPHESTASGGGFARNLGNDPVHACVEAGFGQLGLWLCLASCRPQQQGRDS